MRGKLSVLLETQLVWQLVFDRIACCRQSKAFIYNKHLNETASGNINKLPQFDATLSPMLMPCRHLIITTTSRASSVCVSTKVSESETIKNIKQNK